MTSLFYPVALFDLHQTIYLVKENQPQKKLAITTLEEAPAVIAEYCNKLNITNVKIVGNLEYAGETKNAILTYAKTNYNLNNLEIEVHELV